MKINLKLLGIFILGLLLRIILLSQIPSGLHRDEVSTGYNAYSIIKTGKDEYQRSVPLVFEAFGDWKRPLNIYLSVPFIFIFGLNALSVRLPITILGALSVLLTYLIVKKLFPVKRSLALISALVFAISPWHVFMSRTGLGWNVVGLFFTLIAFLFLLKSFKKDYCLVISSFLWGVTLFTYASNQILTPIFLVLLLFLYFKKIIKNKYFFISLVVFILLFAVFLKVYVPVFQVNAVGSSFINPLYTFTHIEQKRVQSGRPNSILIRLVYNRLTVYSVKFIKNFFTAFSPKTLFLPLKSNKAYSLKNHGNLYLIEIFFLILGLFALRKQKIKKIFLLLGWFFISFVPAALTIDPQASTRSITALFPISVLIAMGINKIMDIFKSKNSQKIVEIVIILGYLTVFSYFIKAYFIDFPNNRAEVHGYGWKKIIAYENKLNPENVYVATPEDQYYIYFLFYNKIKPQVFWDTVNRGEMTRDGFQRVTDFSDYHFIGKIDWQNLGKYKNSLLIKKIDNKKLEELRKYYSEAEEKKIIKLPNGEPEWLLIKT